MRASLAKQHLPFAATVAVFAVLYAAAAAGYSGFFSARVFANFFTDNAVLGIAAIGLTFVILSGGIDLSVGSVVGLTSVLVATLVNQGQMHPALASGAALVVGASLGAAMGGLIQKFHLPPFLVTLAGMFLARGLAFVIRLESAPIDHAWLNALSEIRIPIGDADLSFPAMMFLGLFAAALFVAHWTRFGRNVYAIGGSENSALLMGLPVGGTKVRVYALSGLCSAVAGVIYTVYTFSGNPTAGSGLELDAIAAVVIGGTLLSGGVGYVAGTLVGVLIFGVIQTAIMFQGTLSSWWTKIVVGVLLLMFILLQKLIQSKRLS